MKVVARENACEKVYFVLHDLELNLSNCLKSKLSASKLIRRMGSGCGAVGRAVASDIRGPHFEFSHQQILYLCTITVLKRPK